MAVKHLLDVPQEGTPFLHIVDRLGDFNAADVLALVVVQGVEGDANGTLVVVNQDLDGITVTTVHFMQNLLDPSLAVAGVNLQDVLAEVIIGSFE